LREFPTWFICFPVHPLTAAEIKLFRTIEQSKYKHDANKYFYSIYSITYKFKMARQLFVIGYLSNMAAIFAIFLIFSH